MNTLPAIRVVVAAFIACLLHAPVPHMLRWWCPVWMLPVALVLLGCAPGDGAYPSHPARIAVDGSGDDWTAVPVRDEDQGDGRGRAVGLDRLWVAHSDRYLFLRMEVSRVISLQEDNQLTLYLDTDDNPDTGRRALGLGAEVSWTFGRRSGRMEGAAVGHAALGLHVLPTVRTDVFEIALDRRARWADLVSGERLRVALESRGDRLPDADGGLGYALTDTAVTVDAPTPERPASADVRLLSHNATNDFEAERNAIFKPDRQPHYRRLLDAAGPDVVALQEVYDQTARAVERVAEGPLGLPEGWNWSKRGPDLVLGSRFPIEAGHTIPGYRQFESGAFLLDTRAALGHRLVVVVMHPPCCNDPATDDAPARDGQRQQVVDGVAAFLRRVGNGTGPFGVAPKTPIVVVGDMNFVGDPQQPRTLRTGAIVDTDRFGPGTAPDWDGSSLLDVNPRQTGTPLHTTWVDSTSAFSPGRLDYAFVTDSVLDVPHAFVLFPPGLSAAQRERYGVRRGDAARASDHLPLVIDVAAR